MSENGLQIVHAKVPKKSSEKRIRANMTKKWLKQTLRLKILK